MHTNLLQENTKPVSAMKFFIFSSVVFLLSLTTTNSAASTQTQPHRYAIKLINRDSIFSPYYNPDATLEQRARQVREISIARLEYLAKTSFAHTDGVRAPLVAADSSSLFLVKLSIGEPPVEQILAMDTGSDIVWIQCQPCLSCFNQYTPIFDPSKSSNYQNLSCYSPDCPSTCSVPPCSRNSCDSFSHCRFEARYLDPHTYAVGVMGSDTFSGFFTSDEGMTSIPSVIFGCGFSNQGWGGQFGGILGLGPSSTIFTQLGRKFSYCIGNIYDPNYAHNLLVLGDAAITQGDSTPLEVFDSYYYLTMESISVGEKSLDIDRKIFHRDSEGHGGVIIDSGFTLSVLLQGAYDPLSNEVRSLLDEKFPRVYDFRDPSSLCYMGNRDRDLTGFPVVTFHFAGGAQFVIDTGGFFLQVSSGIFCMAIQLYPPNLHGENIVGVMAQQNYNVGYDINGGKLTIQRIDCELLED